MVFCMCAADLAANVSHDMTEFASKREAADAQLADSIRFYTRTNESQMGPGEHGLSAAQTTKLSVFCEGVLTDSFELKWL